MLRLAVAEHPDVGGDAGVVEHVEGKSDNGFQPVVLHDPTPDIALPLPCVAREKGTAVVHLGNAAARWAVVSHFAQHIGQEHHLPVAGAGD